MRQMDRLLVKSVRSYGLKLFIQGIKEQLQKDPYLFDNDEDAVYFTGRTACINSQQYVGQWRRFLAKHTKFTFVDNKTERDCDCCNGTGYRLQDTRYDPKLQRHVALNPPIKHPCYGCNSTGKVTDIETTPYYAGTEIKEDR
jgi:hypothetical protein